MKRADHRPPRPSDRRLSARSVLTELAGDVDYLAFKERMGEALSPSERALLDAARPAPAPRPIGGGS